MKQVNLMLEDNNLEVYINGDSTRNIVFNPASANFVDKYIALVKFAQEAQNDTKYTAKEVSNPIEGDDDELYGVVEVLENGISAYQAFYDDLCVKVDDLFGLNASYKATLGVVDVNIIINLLDGLATHINQAHNDRVGKYVKPYQAKAKKSRK